jgi:WD40 repeat protein
MAVTPDGKTAAVLWQEDSNGSIDGKFYRKAILIYQWDAPPDEHGELIPKRTVWLEKYQGLNGRDNRGLCLSPDGQTVAFFPADGDSTIYRVNDGTVVAEIKAGPIICASPDGSLIAGGSYLENRPVQVWRSGSGAPIFTTLASAEIISMAFTRDNQKLYVGWKSGTIESFDLASGKSLAKLASKLSPLAISPRGDRFVGFLPDNNEQGSVNETTVLGSLSDGQTVLVLTDGAHILNRAYFSESGGAVAFMKARGSARLARSLTLEEAGRQLELLTPLVQPSAGK